MLKPSRRNTAKDSEARVSGCGIPGGEGTPGSDTGHFQRTYPSVREEREKCSTKKSVFMGTSTEELSSCVPAAGLWGWLTSTARGSESGISLQVPADFLTREESEKLLVQLREGM